MEIQEIYPGLNKKTLQELFQVVSTKTNISRSILEKDLYMTGILMKFIESLENPSQVYFKGGTALSKCHKIISRFSEDCDLLVFTGKHDASRTQEVNLNKTVTNKLVAMFEKDLSEKDGKPLSQRGGDYNKICINYEKTYQEDLFKPHVEFELTSSPLRNKKGYYVSSVQLPIQPIVGEILYKTGMKEQADNLSLFPRMINCTTPQKALCDKVSRLIRISYSENPTDNIIKYIRDFYDITELLNAPQMKLYLESTSFMQDMLNTNKEDSYRNNSHYNESFGQAVIFATPEKYFGVSAITEAYKATIEKFCFEPKKAPQIESVKQTIKTMQPYMQKFDNFKAETKMNAEKASLYTKNNPKNEITPQ